MSEDQPISLKDFGASFMGFLQQAAAQAPVEEPIFVRLLNSFRCGADNSSGRGGGF